MVELFQKNIPQLSAMQESIYAHGKLMITGEYFALDGADVLALPTRFGQKFQVKELSGKENNLFWVALDNTGKPWLQLVFNKKEIIATSDIAAEVMLAKILSAAKDLNPIFFSTDEDIAVQTQLEFPQNWGLGSSSTLIYSIAKWAQVNPYSLLKKTFGGSGYDIACAESNSSIIFRLNNGEPEYSQVNFNPSFKQQLLFVHLGKKQSSVAGISHYKSLSLHKENYVQWLNVVTREMLECATIQKFMQLIQEHENYVSEALKLEKVKQTHFANLPVAAKSLGAWGGDFALLAFEEDAENVKQLLRQNNFDTVLAWNEIILE